MTVEQLALVNNPEGMLKHDQLQDALVSLLRALGVASIDNRKDRMAPDFRVRIDGEWCWFDLKTTEDHPDSLSITCPQFERFEQEYPLLDYVWYRARTRRFYSASAAEMRLMIRPTRQTDEDGRYGRVPKEQRKYTEDHGVTWYVFFTAHHESKWDNDGVATL